MDRKQPSDKERTNSDRGGMERSRWEHRTGEGSDSALANLKTIQRHRERTRPVDDDDTSPE